MPPPLIALLLVLVIGIPLLVVLIVYVVVPVFRGIGWLVGRVGRFVLAEVTDAFRLMGALLAALVYMPMIVLNTVRGRWSRAQHYGRALEGELCAALAAVFRMAAGHPARLFGAQALVEGIEKRLPQAMAAAPPGTDAELRRDALGAGAAVGTPAAPGRSGQFPGYQIIGTLAGGGSGGKLYVARPDAAKLSAFARQGFGPVGDVVIKAFSLAHGSSLPQIVRENRALDAAKRLGLVLEHELTNERYFYVMRYVPGDSLGVVTPRLHAASGGSGLAGRELSAVLGYACDLLGTLHEYHKAGLWHKDVKPDNIIVSGGHAHLVDFGLVTPLRSSMTLTTHGTEYFRDPEMVRLALRGVKVHEVDGARFDIYGAGAVLFSMIENSFPAHGGLSQVTRACPEALRWIIRRAMTDYDKRYPSAQAMLADLAAVAEAARSGNAAALRPADLPSVKEAEVSPAPIVTPVALGPDGAPMHAPPPPPVGRWHGPAAGGVAQGPAVDFAGGAAVGAARTPAGPRRSAADQVAAARGRAAEMRRRAAERLGRTARVETGANYGVAIATLALVTLVAAGVGGAFIFVKDNDLPMAVITDEDGGLTVRAGVASRAGRGGDESDEASVFAAAEPPEPPEAPATPAAPEAPGAKTGTRTVKVPAAKIAPVLATMDAIRSRVGRALASYRLGEAASLGAGTRVLVLAEPGATAGKAREEVLRTILAAHACGFEVLAVEGPGGETEGSFETITGEEFVKLAGDLRVAVGLRPLGGDEAKQAVKAWLGRSGGGEVGAVIWFYPDRDKGDGSLLRIVEHRDGTPERAWRALRELNKAARAAAQR